MLTFVMLTKVHMGTLSSLQALERDFKDLIRHLPGPSGLISADGARK